MSNHVVPTTRQDPYCTPLYTLHLRLSGRGEHIQMINPSAQSVLGTPSVRRSRIIVVIQMNGLRTRPVVVPMSLTDTKVVHRVPLRVSQSIKYLRRDRCTPILISYSCTCLSVQFHLLSYPFIQDLPLTTTRLRIQMFPNNQKQKQRLSYLKDYHILILTDENNCSLTRFQIFPILFYRTITNT